MNCPSRTEESPLHPDWNQNPPFLPFELTTRQDLNGIVNSRQFRENGECAGDDGFSTLDRTKEIHPESPPSSTPPRVAGAKLRLPSRDEACAANPRLFPMLRGSTSNPFIRNVYPLLSWCRKWFWPGITHIILSATFYYIGTMRRSDSMLDDALGVFLGQCRTDKPLDLGGPPPVSRPRVKRASTCEDSKGNGGDAYNTPLHIGAVMIILFVSTAACAFPILAVRFPRLHIPPSFLFIVRHFGTGVLIATAFVHLLPTAFTSLGDPCLPDFWTTDYPAMPGAIALAAVFLVALIEMIFSPGKSMCGNTADVQEALSSPQSSSRDNTTDAGDLNTNTTNDNDNEQKQNTNDKNRPNTLRRASSRRDHDPLCGRSTSMGRGLAQMNVQADQYDQLERAGPESHSASGYFKESRTTEDTEEVRPWMTPEQKRKKGVMQCMLLEMGILFHSIFIGMALSVSVGKEFVILLIAITFHQLFEGLALGARIGALSWEPKALQPWFMALAYGCTTPVGQAIGLATHTLYSPESEVGLIMVGVMNALSAGLLLYASLVELLSEDFLSDESWKLLKGRRRVFACILVFLGAVGMSLIGAWA